MNNSHNMKKMFFIILLFCLASMQAQEYLVPLPVNPSLYTNTSNSHAVSKISTAIKLPFFDDFSWSFVYPDSTLWLDQCAFVHDGYCLNGVTIGCATLDAFDRNGKVYAHLSSFPTIADTLTSRQIRLDSIFTGVPRPATIGDSIYLSFFFQPQGFGDKPETADSLILQFYKPATSEWVTVWSHPGMSYDQFVSTYNTSMKMVMIPINDTAYLKPNFQFRFKNYASIPNNNFPTWISNVDHWNIDYVYINSGRSKTDTTLNDLAFRKRIQTLLKTYSAMPWSHFKVNPSEHMVQSIAIPYKNYSSSLLNVTERLIIYDLTGTTSGYNSGLFASNLNPQVDTVFIRDPFPYTFNALVQKNADFLVQFCINTNTIQDLIRKNDTVQFYQRFYNYFAYDDGSAEMGYVVMGSNAQVAYQFVLSHPDTLRSVQIFFPGVKDDYTSNLFFSLLVWNDQNGKPGEILYEQPYLKPYSDGLNAFHTYVLDQPVPVSGKIYVGYRQMDENGIVIGFDRNTNRKDRIFYATSNIWHESMFEGALMIRIIVGDSIYPYQSIDAPSARMISIFPNPVSDGEHLIIDNTSEEYHIKLINSSGQVVYQSSGSGQTMLPWMFEPGIYFLVLEEKGVYIIRKIVGVR